MQRLREGLSQHRIVRWREGIRLRCVGFDFEPEVTARMLKSGRRILEVPIGYRPRYQHEGKKIRWIDGVDAIYTLLKCRFT